MSASFEVRDMKTGAVRLAAEAGVPVIPVAVWGGRLMNKNRSVPFRARFGVPVSYAFGAPIDVAPTDDRRAVTHRLRETMQGMVDGLQATYPVDGTGNGGNHDRSAARRRLRPRRQRRKQRVCCAASRSSAERAPA